MYITVIIPIFQPKIKINSKSNFAVSSKGKHKVYPYEHTKTSVRRRGSVCISYSLLLFFQRFFAQCQEDCH
jgi:hypothetical protein